MVGRCSTRPHTAAHHRPSPTRRLGRRLAAVGPALLVPDEVHKVPRWSEVAKRLWDEDGQAGAPLHVVLPALNNALVSAQHPAGFEQARVDREHWGHLVESAVGAHLVNTAPPGVEVFWWRDGPDEVDFVLRRGDRLIPVEVKSGRLRGAAGALARFSRRFGAEPGLVVGPGA